MFKIVEKKSLNPTVSKITVEAPLIAKKAEPGQFIIFRAKEDSERILADMPHCPLVAALQSLLDDERAQRNPGRMCRMAVVHKHNLQHNFAEANQRASKRAQHPYKALDGLF